MKTLTREQARAQMKRLYANPMLAPQSDTGIGEIIDCLLRHCRDEEHAIRTMTAFLDTASDPKNVTAELAILANGTRQSDQAPPGCSACEIGEDLDTREMRWALHVIVMVNGCDSARRCTCERGRWLLARDRDRRTNTRQPDAKATHLERIGGAA